MISATQCLEQNGTHRPWCRARSWYQAQVASQGCLLRHNHTFLSALPWPQLMCLHGWASLGCIACLRFGCKSASYKTRKSPHSSLVQTQPSRRAGVGGRPQRQIRPPSRIGLLGRGDGWGSVAQSQGEFSLPRATLGLCLMPSPQASVPPGTSALCSLRASFGPHVMQGGLQPPSKSSIWTRR